MKAPTQRAARVAKLTKISAYPTPDKVAYENYVKLMASGKIAYVYLNGVMQRADHVFGADVKKGTVELAVLGPEGHLQADPKHPPQIIIQHGIKKLKKAGKYKKQRPVIIPSRVLSSTRKGTVRIEIAEPPAPEALQPKPPAPAPAPPAPPKAETVNDASPPVRARRAPGTVSHKGQPGPAPKEADNTGVQRPSKSSAGKGTGKAKRKAR